MIKNMEKIALFIAHGIQNPQWYVKKLQEYDVIVAVDGAANFCKEQGITPNIVIGDFDSIFPEVLEFFSKERSRPFPATQIFHRPSQETTDLQEAIFFARENFPNAQMDILGGISADEFDHTLSNVLFLEMLPEHSKIFTEFQTLFLIKKSGKISAEKGKKISIIAMTDVKNLSYKNLKYPLVNANVAAGWCGTRNECASEICEISFVSGLLLIVLSR
jgi:thiamine pyrophosphokinase